LKSKGFGDYAASGRISRSPYFYVLTTVL